MYEVDVLVIGAGPSGAIVSSLLHQKGLNVLVVEKEQFPRFVIGESLLPFCMNILEKAGFLDAVNSYGFQFKNGAAFSYKDEYCYFDFCDKSAEGFGTTFQVKRGEFDKLLIDEAIKKGVEVRFNKSVKDIDFSSNTLVHFEDGETIKTKFVVDASGYARVLPRLLNLEVPSKLSPKKAYFTHIQDNISEVLYDRNKILITTHPECRECWFWLIPFSDGRCSIGVVGEESFFKSTQALEVLKTNVYQAPMLKRLLQYAKWDTPVRSIESYSKNVSKFYGENYILLGNAGEFLDPVFSSGVSIAMYSAYLAANVISKKLNNEVVDFEKEYSEALMVGVDTFRVYVNEWYSGRFQDIIYSSTQNHEIKRQISSILAGYVWDNKNPYVKKAQTMFETLAQYCKK